MQTVTPGASHQEVTPIADGTWHFGGDWESVDEQAAVAGLVREVLLLDKTAKRLPSLIHDVQPQRDRGRPRTPSPGPTPTRSTPRCWTSCAAETRPHATQPRGGSHKRH